MKRMTNTELMNKFIDFVKEYLEISTSVTIKLTKDRTNITTTAYYNFYDNHICVYIKDRAICDVMRSLAHELVHHKQNEDGRLTDAETDGSDGSDIENEANSIAGVIMRIFGKQNPEIFTNNE